MESESKQVPPPYTQGGNDPLTQQPGYPNQQQNYPPPPDTTFVTVQPNSAPQTVVIMGGNCPACRTGVLHKEFTCMGIFCCLIFFPIMFTGLICLFAMKRKVCLHCGARF